MPRRPESVVERVRHEERRKQALRRLAIPAAVLLLVAAAFGARALWQLRTLAKTAIEKPSAPGEIDFADVHRNLLPTWISAGFDAMSGDDPGKREWAESGFRKLRAAIESDPDLTHIADEWHDIPRAELGQKTDYIIELGEEWNRAVDRHGAPFLVEAKVFTRGASAFLYINTYHLMTGLKAEIPSAKGTTTTREYEVRILERIDGLALREHYLGRASHARDGALVVVDRVRDFAVDSLWPLCDPALDHEGPPLVRTLGSAVRDEMQQALPKSDSGPSAIEVLRRTAATKLKLRATIGAVNRRATECGKEMRLLRPPWNGFSTEKLKDLEQFVSPDGADRCALLTESELGKLWNASKQLQADPALDDAVRALEAWATRAVAIHELRHVIDDERHHGASTPLPCDGCSNALGADARMELGAYLASIAAKGVSAVALYQAVEVFDSAGARFGQGEFPDEEPHIAALRFLLPQIMESEQQPKADYAEKAAAIDRRLFGDGIVEPVLPSHYPVRLPPSFNGSGNGASNGNRTDAADAANRSDLTPR